MDVALAVRVLQGFERLRDDLDRLRVGEPAAARVRESRGVRALHEFRDEVDDALVRAAVYEADDVRVLQGGGHVNLAHEAAQRLVRDGDFRQERLDGDGLARLLVAREHDAAHPAAA